MSALACNPRRAAAPGNVLLDPGEADLSRQSVINPSQIVTLDKAFLEDGRGTLSPAWVRQILDGVRLVLERREDG